MNYFYIETSITDRSVVLSLHGELDMETRQHLKKVISDLRQLSEHDLLVLDCKHMCYISCDGINTLLSLASSCQARGVQVILCQLQPKVQDVLELSGSTDKLKIVPTLEDAQQAI
ncbi:STAS domain-containing protein [Pontibacter korlensis]|uniref:Anti-sigma factor antagonist n=1 Tax=Pontibacter korlensis TaxID=400092 RepID=A0A0E3ZGR5_9BACT|nr:STAS domain-containing protein [Pontibacter korlensis]AKD05070.1 hypothetical protein PKOR_20820 [Pontibacter korlensis]